MAQPHARSLANGALVRIDPDQPTPEYIYFQFNPSTLSRQIQPRVVGDETGGHTEAVRFTGAPYEVFSFVAEIDALSDHFTYAGKNAAAAQAGFFSQLYTLEMLLNLDLSQVKNNASQLQDGAIEIAPHSKPQVLFVWGPNRVVPIVTESMTISEQMFDTNLNPVRASVSIKARVLSHSDVTSQNASYQRFMSYQSSKEKFAKNASTTNGGSSQSEV